MENEVVYKPCKKCGSTDYDNADIKDMTETAEGKFIFEPEKCDQCDFMLALSDSNLYH